VTDADRNIANGRKSANSKKKERNAKDSTEYTPTKGTNHSTTFAHKCRKAGEDESASDSVERGSWSARSSVSDWEDDHVGEEGKYSSEESEVDLLSDSEDSNDHNKKKITLKAKYKRKKTLKKKI